MKYLRWAFPIAVLSAVAVATAFVVLAPNPKPYADVMKDYRSSELVLLDRNGVVLQESRQLNAVRRLPWTKIGEVPLEFLKLVVRAEDQRFMGHHGIDFLALGKSGLYWTLGKSSRGASTISMQVSELLSRGGRGGQRRNWRQKFSQMHAAIGLERSWSKEQILEAYMNLLYYRGELQGIAAAAQGIFGKAPFGLNEWEAAATVALIRAPNADGKRVMQRACHLLEQLECKPPEEVVKRISAAYWIRPLEKSSPHIARHLGVAKAGGRMTTSLDRDLQIRVREILASQVEKLRQQNLTDAAAVVLDNQSGEVLAYVGNIGERSASPHVDAAFSQRQAGSTLKPFFYGLAIQKKLITAATILQDKPTDVAVATGIYRPANYDRKFRENVSARIALASSLNIPAVQVLEAVGVENTVDMLNELGFSGLERPDFYGPSVALGSVDVRLLELTNAYRTLANLGTWTPVRFDLNSETSKDAKEILTPAAAYIIGNMIADRGSRGATFGWENALGTRFWTAVKTGTSKDMRDNWCVGYSQRYTVGVWAGNLTGAPMWNVSGVQGAAPAWLEIMNQLHVRYSSHAPEAPENVVRKNIRYDDGGQTFNEWFIAGTEPPQESIRVVQQNQSKLLYPVDQTLVALDPDIPVKQQKIFFSVEEPQSSQKLLLNGKRLAAARSQVGWTPYPGKFKLELVDGDGRPVDAVHFQVRGHSRSAADP